MIKKFLDLGYQPLANSYLLKKYLNHKEETFKLEVGFNKKNYLVSILKTVPKEKDMCTSYHILTLTLVGFLQQMTTLKARILGGIEVLCRTYSIL